MQNFLLSYMSISVLIEKKFSCWEFNNLFSILIIIYI